jgi:hypothetical protein
MIQRSLIVRFGQKLLIVLLLRSSVPAATADSGDTFIGR